MTAIAGPGRPHPCNSSAPAFSKMQKSRNCSRFGDGVEDGQELRSDLDRTGIEEDVSAFK